MCVCVHIPEPGTVFERRETVLPWGMEELWTMLKILINFNAEECRDVIHCVELLLAKSAGEL